MATTHPNASKDKKVQYWCLGNQCPPDYELPYDWDVLELLPRGVEPARKKLKTTHAEATKTPRATKSSATKAQEIRTKSIFGPLQKPEAKPTFGPPASSHTSGPKFPKTRIPIAPKTPKNLGGELAELKLEASNLRATRDFADRKVRALTMFGSHQDNAIAVLGAKFFKLKVAPDIPTRERVEKEINDIMAQCNMAHRGPFRKLSGMLCMEHANILQAQRAFFLSTTEVLRKELVSFGVLLCNLAEKTKRQRRETSALANYVQKYIQANQPTSTTADPSSTQEQVHLPNLVTTK